MKNQENKQQEIEKLLTLYNKYKAFKEAPGLVSNKKLPSLGLNQQIENANPYYMKSGTTKYSQSKKNSAHQRKPTI